MKKKSITAIKKDIRSMIREVVIQFKPLDTERIKVDNPAKVSEFISEKIGNDARENFILLCIGNKNEVVSYSVISVGTITEAIVHPREVFIPAIMTKASGIIVAHNHPSGSNLPSRQDIETTKRLVEVGKVIGIPLVDHIIVGFNNDNTSVNEPVTNYYSLKENGYIS